MKKNPRRKQYLFVVAVSADPKATKKAAMRDVRNAIKAAQDTFAMEDSGVLLVAVRDLTTQAKRIGETQ